MKRKRQPNSQIYPKWVYCITENDVPIYIGSTTKSLDVRLMVHKNNSPYSQIRNGNVSIELIDIIEDETQKGKENWYIELFKDLDYPILNQNKALHVDPDNLDEVREQNTISCLEYRINNRFAHRKYMREYYRDWRNKNRDEYNEYHRIYEQNKLK